MKRICIVLVSLVLVQCAAPPFAYGVDDLSETVRNMYGKLEELEKKVIDQEAQINALRIELKKSKNDQSARVATEIILKKTPEEIIQIAIDKMSSGDTENARHLLNAFIKNNPQNIYVGKMEYYIGNAYFQEKKYKEAADAYLGSYEHNSNGSKSAESLHKLAQCLEKLSKMAELKEKKDELLARCQVTAKKLINDHPNYDQIASVKREFGIP
ncbi:MAG: tetratricopeptide repeat protein [Holosporaceae bacterium]|nr:tetratricopeptide repeat protein [Holosporaceae bacterium]